MASSTTDENQNGGTNDDPIWGKKITPFIDPIRKFGFQKVIFDNYCASDKFTFANQVSTYIYPYDDNIYIKGPDGTLKKAPNNTIIMQGKINEGSSKFEDAFEFEPTKWNHNCGIAKKVNVFVPNGCITIFKFKDQTFEIEHKVVDYITTIRRILKEDIFEDFYICATFIGSKETCNGTNYADFKLKFIMMGLGNTPRF
ncbi:unnamed protein product [Diamesa serratosioi]